MGNGGQKMAKNLSRAGVEMGDKMETKNFIDDAESTTSITELTGSLSGSRLGKDTTSLPLSMTNYFPNTGSDDEDNDGEQEEWTKEAKLDQFEPRGLTCLENIDKILILHRVEFQEIFMGFEKKNKFDILTEENSHPRRQLYSGEQAETEFCARLCHSPSHSQAHSQAHTHTQTQHHPDDIVITDGVGQVINLSRNVCTADPSTGWCCCMPCCLQSIDVYGGGRSNPASIFFGRIQQQCSLWQPKFRVLDGKGDTTMVIEGQGFFPNNVDFLIFALHGPIQNRRSYFRTARPQRVQVGKILRKMSGSLKLKAAGLGYGASRDGDTFELNFERDMDVQLKAILIGACILIQWICFENSALYPIGRKQKSY